MKRPITPWKASDSPARRVNGHANP
jgi:hypothetical protein